MKKLKQILCAILNCGHKYPIDYIEEVSDDKIDLETGTKYVIRTTELVRKPCSCGKLWERKR